MVILPSCTVSWRHMKHCYYGSRQQSTPWPRVYNFALPRTWSQSVRETLQTDNREWTYIYLDLRLARMLVLLLQLTANGALTKLSAEHAHGFLSLQVYRAGTNMIKNDVMDCPRHCLGRRCSSSDRRHSKRIPVISGGPISKWLSGVAGMQWFRACRVANRTNETIQRTQSLKYKQLPNTNRACNICRGWWQLLRAL